MGGSGHGQAYWCHVCLEELSETVKDTQDILDTSHIDGSSAVFLVMFFG